MKIGIILYSNTGNTRVVGNQLEMALTQAGHEVMLLEVMSEGTPPNVNLTAVPDPTPYDMVIFGGPVQAFTACVTMKKYLQGLPNGFDKKFACFVTQYLPFKWLGGENAVKVMKGIVEEKGGHYIGHGVINWSRNDRQSRMDLMVLHIQRLIEIEMM